MQTTALKPAHLTPLRWVLAASLLALGTAHARQPAPDEDRTGSPFFYVPGGDPSVDTLPLKETRADVSISGVIAHVKVTQVYENAGSKPLEAIYIFPGSTRAAVFAMRMTVGDRVIEAEIQKKADARKMYEDAKREGKTASLLEQQRPNVFQMNVANILPGDQVRVELDYAEGLVPEDGTYEFVYPAVVGPRYTGESDKAEGFTETPYHHAGEGPTYGWDLSVHLAAGMKLKQVSSATHPIATTLTSEDVADITLSDKGAAGTKDFVLRYTLAGATIDSGVLLYEGQDGENFFLAMLQPPARVEARMKPRREYVFILDVSGSMHGFPLETAKGVMRGLLAGMNAEDRFNILCFSGGNAVLSPQSLAVTPENLARAEGFMQSMRGGGGTEILGALREALAMKNEAGYARTFVAVTDGYVSVEPQVFRTIRDNLGEASFFAFGIGSSVNRHLIEGMARMGLGEPFFVMNGEEGEAKAKAFERYIDAPVLTDIKVGFEGFAAYDVEPRAIPDLFASRPVMVFGKYRGKAKGRITITGTSGAGAFSQRLEVGRYAPSASHKALRTLWARHRIATLSDLMPFEGGDKQVAEVTALGLKYHLMTAYTSFIAVDQRVRNKDGKLETVKQPLPLPDGVSDLAVPAAAPYAPAPTMAFRSVDASAKMMVAESGNGGPGLGGGAGVKSGAKDAPATAKVLRTETVSGPLSDEAIRNVVRRYAPRLARCLEQHASVPHLVVKFTLTIDANGLVTSVVSDVNSYADLQSCLSRALKNLRFPTASGQTVATVSVELSL